MIAIIDYDTGNLRSVQKAFEKVGADAVVTQDPAVIERCGKLVLPGVGAMNAAMNKLQSMNLIAPILNAISQKKPFLGICLGMQLLFNESNEGGKVKGFGVLPGKVIRFNHLKVPHMGWNQIDTSNQKCPLFKGIPNLSDVYFCHSYYALPQNGQIVSAVTEYGKPFASAVWSDNIFAVQFHPEKSQTTGLGILKNFTSIYDTH